MERVRTRGDRPGLVKVELSSVQEKVTVLHRKSNLKDNNSFNKVYVSSAKSHAERLMDLNFRTLIRETAVGKDFYLAANGRMVKRTQAPRRERDCQLTVLIERGLPSLPGLLINRFC